MNRKCPSCRHKRHGDFCYVVVVPRNKFYGSHYCVCRASHVRKSTRRSGG